jgi:hypothetical protein
MRPYESRDVHVGTIWAVAIVLAAVVTSALAASYFMVKFLGSPSYPQAPATVPEIKLSPNRRQQLRAYRDEQRAKLNSFGWVDKDAGIARIPIDRAFDLLTQAAARPPEAAPIAPTEDKPSDGAP